MKKHILFVEREIRIDKLGILYLAAVLKQAGHHVDLVQDIGDDIDSYLTQHQDYIDFVMYSVVSGRHQWYLEKNRELRRKYQFISVMGGPHFTFFPEDGVDDPFVDYVVRGPAEDVIVSIVEDAWLHDKVVWGRIPDLTTVPPPHRDILYKYPRFGSSPVKRFIAGRDCPNACTYCFNHLYHHIFRNQKARFMQITAPDRMVDEVQDVRDRWGLKLAYFNDDDIARDKAWLQEFCQDFRTRVPGVEFGGYARADSLDQESVQMLARSGCVFLIVALEAANPKTQKLLRRGRITTECMREAVRLCSEAGIRVRLQNMIGLPVDDPWADALETLQFNLEANPTESSVAIFQPLPGTDIHDYCLRNGFITSDTECDLYFGKTVLNIPDAEKISRLARWWHFATQGQFPIRVIEQLAKIPLVEEQQAAMLDLQFARAARTVLGIDFPALPPQGGLKECKSSATRS